MQACSAFRVAWLARRRQCDGGGSDARSGSDSDCWSSSSGVGAGSAAPAALTQRFFQCAGAAAASLAADGFLGARDVLVVRAWLRDLLALGYRLPY